VTSAPADDRTVEPVKQGIGIHMGDVVHNPAYTDNGGGTLEARTALAGANSNVFDGGQRPTREPSSYSQQEQEAIDKGES
jgi:hypothetical protein